MESGVPSVHIWFIWNAVNAQLSEIGAHDSLSFFFLALDFNALQWLSSASQTLPALSN